MAARDWASVYLKGMAMGAADAVPGVSGGTIALITGIYERLVDALASIDPADVLALVPLVAQVPRKDVRAELRVALTEMDVPFLLVLGFGLITAVVTVANVVEVASHAYPGPTYAFFFGLVLASVYALRDEATLESARGVAVAVVGFVFALAVSGPLSATIPATPLTTLLVGSVVICAMVLPGVSGSLILLTLGYYEVMTGAVSDATNLLFDGQLDAAMTPIGTLVVFSVGALIGLLTFARIVSWAFETNRRDTLTFLVALMAGALWAPGKKILEATPEATVETLAPLLVMGVIGAGAVLALDYYTDDLEY